MSTERIEEERFSTRINVMIRPSDYARFQNLCAGRGLEVSEVIRQAIGFITSNPAKFADAASAYLNGRTFSRLKDAELAFGEYDGSARETHEARTS